MPPIKAIIFDLDNCLSSAKEVGEELFEPGFEAIRDANHGRLSDAALAEAFEDYWRHPLDFVAKKHGFSEEMFAASWNVFAKTEMKKPMQGYPDLGLLAEIPAMRFLVTSGFRRLQESKIVALGITRLFNGIYVDAIDESSRKGKQGVFAEILQENQLRPEETLVVGDNPDSEIAAGNALGMPTVQILRPGVTKDASAKHHIDGLAGVLDLVGGG